MYTIFLYVQSTSLIYGSLSILITLYLFQCLRA